MSSPKPLCAALPLIVSLLALEMARPSSIRDEDCSVELPKPIDDSHIHSHGIWIPTSPSTFNSPLIPTIEVMCGISKLLRILRRPCLTVPTLKEFDDLFSKSMAAFPAHQQVDAPEHLPPAMLPPMIYAQNARLLLHRHNLHPLSDPHVRSAAIDHCVVVAKDTARLLQRSMQQSPEPDTANVDQDSWQTQMHRAANAFLCTHVWRCSLFLCFRGDFESALRCIQVSTAIGDARPINLACSRYLDFFLGLLVPKLGSSTYLDSDEDLLAYLSADLQGSPGNSWIWKDGQEAQHVGARSGESSTNQSPGDAKAPDPAAGEDWNRWPQVLRMIQGLQGQQQVEQRGQAQNPQADSRRDSAHTMQSPSAGRQQSVPTKISIADIM